MNNGIMYLETTMSIKYVIIFSTPISGAITPASLKK